MKLDPQTIRQRMIKSYTDSYRRSGKSMAGRDIERLVVADCELVDNAKSAGDISTGAKPKKPAPRVERPDPLKDALNETGTRLTVRDEGEKSNAIKIRAFHGNPLGTSERFGFAMGRIKRILEHANTDTSSLVTACTGTGMSDLVLAVMELFADFDLHNWDQPDLDFARNRFKGLVAKDAARKFVREVEDIADKSTGRLGSWYVK